jgi:leucyl/phenylalanyl-tRNA--protein transferase
VKNKIPPLSVDLLLSAYTQGIFPMASEDKEIGWYCPDPRAIIPLENYKASKSLRPILNKQLFEIRLDQQFEQVMRNCAAPRGEDNGVWISEEMIKVYVQMHQFGFAHSVEAYQNNELVGGLYGIALGGVFYGESMFSKVSNASKVAFHYLIDILKKNNYELLDTQFMNDNVKRYGAIEIPQVDFLKRLDKALQKECQFIL